MPVFNRGGLQSGAATLRFGGLDIDMNPSPFISALAFDKLSVDIRSFREPLQTSIQKVLAPSFQRNFDEGGRPAWEPLSQMTIQRKQREGRASASKPLVRSGKLKRVAGQLNIWTITRDMAYIASLPGGVWYGTLHQRGTGSDAFDTGFPPRPWAVVQEEDARAIDQIFYMWMEGRIAKAGLR